VLSCRVPELGVLVVGVTSWSGEGIEPKFLEVMFELSKVLPSSSFYSRKGRGTRGSRKRYSA
jgi:hypothetical protein